MLEKPDAFTKAPVSMTVVPARGWKVLVINGLVSVSVPAPSFWNEPVRNVVPLFKEFAKKSKLDAALNTVEILCAVPLPMTTVPAFVPKVGRMPLVVPSPICRVAPGRAVAVPLPVVPRVMRVP